MYFEFKHLKNTRFEVVELLVSLVFTFSCLFLFWLFPAGLNDPVEKFLRLFIFLVVFPITYTKIILKKNSRALFTVKPYFDSKLILSSIIFLIIEILSFLIIIKTSLGNHYLTKILPLAYLKSTDGFKAFLVYEIIIAIFFLISIFFAFGFVNLITENFNKLNFILPILIFYLLALYFFTDEFYQNYLIVFLIILPTFLFKKIVNYSQSIWFFYFLFLFSNIVFNAIIIKLFI